MVPIIDVLAGTQKLGSPDNKPVTYTVPGSFGLAIQGSQQVAGGFSHRKVPSCFTTRKAAITFQGYLSNLGELVDELCYRSFPEPGSSYESEFGRGSFQPVSRGDQAMLAAEVLLHMYLQASDPNQLTILLSELQGQFSFVIFDSSKRRVFAARDASGTEPLYMDYDEDGAVFSFTNNPQSVLGEGSNTWQEVLPGHFCSGKNPKQMQQFALTPTELHLREQAETSDLSISPDTVNSPKAGNGQSMGGSARNSLEQDWKVDRLFRISV